MSESPLPVGVTVATVLRDLADSRSLDLELLAGGDGLDRRITNPHPQKTGLALSGFDAYLRGGRILVFGESEIRYLESLEAPDRSAVMRRVLNNHDLPGLLIWLMVLPVYYQQVIFPLFATEPPARTEPTELYPPSRWQHRASR